MTPAQKTGQMQATLLGVIPVLVWGGALPIVRAFQSRIGLPRTIGVVFVGAGVLGILHQRFGRASFPPKTVFANPYLYGRWLFFVLHEASICVAVSIVQKRNVPLVILMNYLWPTVTIAASVLIASVRVVRPLAVLGGTSIVIASLAFEMLRGRAGSIRPLTSGDLLACAGAFVGALSWGLYSALTRRAGKESGGGAVLPLFQLTLGLALPLSFVPGFNVYSIFTPTDGILLGLYCVLQFIAYLCWDHGMRLGNVVVISLFADFIPWLSLVAAHFLLGVAIQASTMLSAFTLVIGAIATRYGTSLKSVGTED